MSSRRRVAGCGRGIRALVAGCSMFAAACMPAGDAQVRVPAELEDAVARIEAFIAEQMELKELDAVSIALVDDQRIVWSRGFGMARPADSIPAGPATVYRVGSVSKLFTDIAIMQRVAAGTLALDSPVVRYLPEFAPEDPHGTPITLRQLMAHRSGLVREPPVGHYFDATEPTLEATVASLNDTRLVLAPGERTKYSNAGIAVVGRVLERVDGRPFAQILEEDVLGPAGLTRSSFSQRPDLMADLATATMWGYDGRTFEAPGFALGMAPAGSMYSTVEDLGRFLSVLFAGGQGENGRMLAAASLDSMWTPQFGGRYGIGFALGDIDGHRTIGHGGAIYGFATELAALPDEKLGVVVVTTRDLANDVMSRIAEFALRSVLAARAGGPLPEAETTSPLPAGRAAALEGRWEGRDGGGFELVDRAGRLHATRLGSGFRTELRARGDTLVIDDVIAYGARLLPLSNDLMLAGGDTLRRVATDLPPPAPPARWLGLIGEYGWDYNTLFILERDGRLYSLIEWAFLDPLEELSPDTYRFPAGSLYASETLSFTRDAAGRATAASVGGVVFARRAVGTEAGETFRITPVRPVDELRAEALAATPPASAGATQAADLVELSEVDPEIRYDIRYATTNNFMSARFYTEPHAFMQRPAADAVGAAAAALAGRGYGLLIHDAYRPWHVTKMFWDATPADMKQFVADPASGSRHNRGAAVDLTLYDRRTGEVVEMTGGYDEFSPRSYPDYPGGTSRQRWHRELLRDALETRGFTVYEWEWWHFDFDGWRDYPVLNLTFEELQPAGAVPR